MSLKFVRGLLIASIICFVIYLGLEIGFYIQAKRHDDEIVIHSGTVNSAYSTYHFVPERSRSQEPETTVTVTLENGKHVTVQIIDVPAKDYVKDSQVKIYEWNDNYALRKINLFKSIFMDYVDEFFIYTGITLLVVFCFFYFTNFDSWAD